MECSGPKAELEAEQFDVEWTVASVSPSAPCWLLIPLADLSLLVNEQCGSSVAAVYGGGVPVPIMCWPLKRRRVIYACLPHVRVDSHSANRDETGWTPYFYDVSIPIIP